MADESASDRDVIEQVAESFVIRFRAGQRPSIEEYAGRYPELAEELRELLPALVLLEQNASLDDTAAHGGDTKVVAPREIGDFSIVREIGRGGMGVVYEAVQQSLGRHVALKVLSTPALLNPTHLERFRLEARAAARLHHTHIVPVFGVGEHGGLHYYAMQFIQGQSLDLVVDALRELRRHERPGDVAPGDDKMTRAVADGLLTGCFRAEPGDSKQEPNAGEAPALPTAGNAAELLPPTSNSQSHTEFTSSHGGREFYRSVARVTMQVAEALAYAHSEGILHRDIKPSNLLLDAKGNVWVTDFGLAKSEGTDGLTQTGDFVGTLRYMAPERLEGWSDRRSDLYSLGATLYELLTLRPFLESSSRGQLVDKILHENPPPPSKADRMLPRDLETIVLKAIAKEPTARYRTAEEFAEDLRLFLADRPVLARRSTPSEQFVRWCRRNPAMAGLIATVFTLLVGGVAASSYFAASAAREAELADVQRQRAERVSTFFMDDIVGLADPKRNGRSGISLVESLDSAANGIDNRFPNDPDLRADVRDRFGQIYSGIDEPQKAVVQLQQAVELRQALSGASDPATLKSNCNLGYALYQAGRYREAKDLLQRTLAVQSETLGAGHPDSLETTGRLAITLMELRDPNTTTFAGDAYHQALSSLGPQHYTTLDAQCTYAWILRWDGESDRALELAEVSARGLKNLKGEQDVRAMYASYNYASCLLDVGRASDAAVELKSLLAVRKRVLGASHIDTLWTTMRLAEVLYAMGDASESQSLFRDLMSKINRRTKIPPSMLNGFAWTLASSPYPALRNGERAVALATEGCHATSYAIAAYVDTLAAAYAETGDAAAVAKWSRKVLELEPTKVMFHYDAALRVLWSGRDDEYREICALTANRFEAATDETTRFSMVWTCGLGPAGPRDLGVILKNAQELVRNQPANARYKSALGVLLYRHGDFEQATKCLSEVVADAQDDSKELTWALYPKFFLAMSHWQLGHPDLARQMLTETQAAMDEAMKSFPAWNRRMTCDVFRREAEALIKPAEASVDTSTKISGDTFGRSH